MRGRWRGGKIRERVTDIGLERSTVTIQCSSILVKEVTPADPNGVSKRQNSTHADPFLPPLPGGENYNPGIPHLRLALCLQFLAKNDMRPVESI